MVMTTSGRAALYQALCQLNIPVGNIVLCPTYHCPTMIAPALLAGLEVAYYPLGEDGLPDLKNIPTAILEKTGAIIVAHYFGMAKSLANVRTWCDLQGIALIEDCAHCLFGHAGEQAVGTWGDFATASLSKFLPLPEAGILASNRRTIAPFKLDGRSLKAQIKGVVDVVEFSSGHHGFWPISMPMNTLFGLKNVRGKKLRLGENKPAALPDLDMMHQCDMGRIGKVPLWISRRLSSSIHWGPNIRQRRQNFMGYLAEFEDVPGVRPLYPLLRDDTVPYVFPLWVEDGDQLYEQIRAQRLPVFRWDRIWPGTPLETTDHGPRWGKHVLQLLCHQSLSQQDISMVSSEIKRLARSIINSKVGTN